MSTTPNSVAHPLTLAAGGLLVGLGSMVWLHGTGDWPSLAWLAVLPVGALAGGALVAFGSPALSARLALLLLLLASAAWWFEQPLAGRVLATLALGCWLPALTGARRAATGLALMMAGAALALWLLSLGQPGTLDRLLQLGLPVAILPWLVVPARPDAGSLEVAATPDATPFWQLWPSLLLAAPLTALPLVWAPPELARITALSAPQWLALLWPALLAAALVAALSGLLVRGLGARWSLRLALLLMAALLPWLAGQLRAAVHPQLAAFRAEVPLTLVTVDCPTQDPCAQVREHLLALGLDVRIREQPVPEPWLELDGQAVDLLSLEWLGNALTSFNFPNRAEPQVGPARLRMALVAALSALLLVCVCVWLARGGRSWLLVPLTLTALLAMPLWLHELGRLLVLRTGLAQAGVWVWSALALLALLASFLLPRRR